MLIAIELLYEIKRYGGTGGYEVKEIVGKGICKKFKTRKAAENFKRDWIKNRPLSDVVIIEKI